MIPIVNGSRKIITPNTTAIAVFVYVTSELRAGPSSAISLKNRIKAKAVLKTQSAINDNAAFIEILDGH